MKILYYTLDGCDVPTGNHHLMYAMIDDFLCAGHQVHVIFSRRTDTEPYWPPLLRERGGFSADIVKRKTVGKTKLVRRFIEEFGYALRCIPAWRRNKEADVILIQSTPTAVFNVLFAKWFAKKPIVLSIFDMFPGTAWHTGALRSRFLKGVFERMQRITYRCSDLVTAISEDMKRKAMAAGVPEHKIRVIVNWYDDSAVREVPWEENRFVQAQQMEKEKFYVQYAGNMGYTFDHETWLRVADRLRNQTDIVFQLIGHGNRKDRFEAQAKDMGLTNMVFLPWQPLEMIADVYSACDVCMIPLPEGVIGNSAPGKAPLLMACGRVVISAADEDSAYAQMFNQNGIGVCVPSRDDAGLAEAILQLYHDRAKLNAMGKKAKAFSEQVYARRNNSYKFLEAFDEVKR